MSTVDMTTHIGRLMLKNPVMVASGTFGYGIEYSDLMDVNVLGALVTKGLSLAPRQGNPAPRIVETPSGMLNSIGLENPGFEKFIQEKLPWLKEVAPAAIVNIFGSTIEEYAQLAELLDSVEGVDGLEINISCPNIDKGGLAFGTDAEVAYRVSSEVRQKTSKPILVKLSPNVTDIVAIAKRVAQAQIDGITLINTLKGMAIDYFSGRPLLGNRIGGLSGPAIRPIAIRAVFEVHQEIDIPIVGCGGIVDWKNAVEFLRAGASAVQIGSATFRNPLTAIEVLNGLHGFLLECGKNSIQELIGAVRL